MIKGKTSFGICVGIATRNAEKYLPSCLRSLTAQTAEPDEYVICIGPSNDKTEELIQDFVKRTSVPAKVIYDRDGIGTGYARKAIVENCTQEYVAWVDSDYILAPNWLDTIIKIIERDNCDYLDYHADENYVTLSEAISMDRRGELPDLINMSLLERMTRQPGGIKVVRCRAAVEVGNYDPFFTRGQDMDLYIRLVNRGYRGVGYKRMNLYHIWEGMSLKKALSRAVYLKYLYKYGLGYVFLGGRHTEHLIAFLLRSCIVGSFPLLGFCLVTGTSIVIPLLMFLTGASGLVGGLILVHSKDSFSLTSCVNQFGKSFGEYYLLYKILTTKNKPKRGYGKKYIAGVDSRMRNGEVS